MRTSSIIGISATAWLLRETSRPDTVQITLFLSGKAGFLWVSDNSGKSNSPKTQFSFSFRDTVGPTIVCINTNARNDTIQTGDRTFTFLARINALQNTSVGSASVNGQSFDIVDASQQVYVKTLFGLAGHTQLAGALTLYIKATDSFNNISEKVFYVVHNAPPSAPVAVLCCPSSVRSWTLTIRQRSRIPKNPLLEA